MKAQSKYYKISLSGNIRQLRNVAEQISVLETNRDITAAILQSYLPSEGSNLPSVIKKKKAMAILVTKERFCIKYF
jgi:DNA-binding NtrC family response regulator